MKGIWIWRVWDWIVSNVRSLGAFIAAAVGVYIYGRREGRQRESERNAAAEQKRKRKEAEKRNERMRHAKRTREEVTSLERDDLDDRLRDWHRDD